MTTHNTDIPRKIDGEPAAGPEGIEQEAHTKRLPAAALRALAEAQARRVEMEAREAAMPREIGGRGGKDPARYGDWEAKGRASDF